MQYPKVNRSVVGDEARSVGELPVRKTYLEVAIKKRGKSIALA